MMIKKQADLPNGYALRPITIGKSAYIDDGHHQHITSKVVAINEAAFEKMVIETIYTVNKAI